MTVWLSLGSNKGDRLKNLKEALKLISKKLRIEKISPVFETEGWGSDKLPDFYNIALKCDTNLPPFKLLRFLESIERRMGREKRKSDEYKDRIMDIDIILFGNMVIKTPELEIPHPLAHKRKFVLVPVLSTGEDPAHPVLKKRFSKLLAETKNTKKVKETHLKVA